MGALKTIIKLATGSNGGSFKEFSQQKTINFAFEREKNDILSLLQI